MSARAKAAATSDLRAADAEARRIAVDEFDRPVAIEAGAGTGKTRALVARLATWLLGPGWERAAAELADPEGRGGRPFAAGPPSPDEIAARVADGVVAITFTEAAAAEMAERLGSTLSELASGKEARDLDPLPPRLAGVDDLEARARALAAVLSRARVQTIHSFCAALLAEHPFEARLHPELEIDADGARLAAAAKDALVARLRASDEALLALVARGTDPVEIHEALVKLVASGAEPVELARPRFTAEAAGAILERFASAVARLAPRLDALAAAVGRKSPRTALAADSLARLRVEADSNGEPFARLVRLAEAVRDEREEWRKSFSVWMKQELGANERKQLAEGADEFLDFALAAGETLDELCALDPELYERARKALGPLVEETRRRLKRAGALSYEDLLAEAARLLESNAWVRRRVRASIRQLLVDEFQDTDRRQCRLLSALAFGGDGAGPGLFVVGDPKQSIYAWRSADLGAYESFLAELAGESGVQGRLAMNFRSAPPILAEVETSVGPAMVAEAGVQPPFEPLFAGDRTAKLSGFRDESRAPVEFWLSWDGEAIAAKKAPKVERAAEIEAGAIAHEIAALVRDGAARFGDFALLLRARGDLESYLDALRRAGVPYSVQKDRSYYRRREVIDAVSLLRLVLDPADRLAMVAALRSPFVGVPDAAWIPLFRHGFPEALERLATPEPEALGLLAAIVGKAATETSGEVPGIAALADWPLALGAAVAGVAELRAAFRDESLPIFLERLRSRFLLEPVAASRFLGRFGLANLGRLFAEIETRFGEAADPLAALAELRLAVEEEADSEEARPPDAGLDAVQVMTIHTAKGLEFEQVFVAQLHKRASGGSADRDATERIGPERAPSGLAEHRLLGAPSPGWAAASGELAAARDAETVRLLYVAMTRAKSRLVMLGCWERERKENGASSHDSFLARLAGRRPAELETLFDPQAPPSLLDRGALWRRLETAAPPPAAVREEAAPRAPGEGAIVTREARDAARRRGARSRFATASSLAAASEETATDPEAALREPRISTSGAGEIARARGVALHRALELAALHRDSAVDWRDRVVASYRAERGSLPLSEAAALGADLDALVASSTWRRLEELEASVLSRELPLISAVPASAEDGPLDGHLGTLDLLYRDPGSGDTVIADFKSDPAPAAAAEIDPWIEAKVERYRLQLALYGRAVERALALTSPPRLELWLLSVDRIVAVPWPAAR